jgi:hypothetical protein
MKTWVKTLGIISIVLIVLDIILMIIAASTGDGLGAGLLIALILFPLLAIIIGAWLIGFLLIYIKNRNKTLANIIAVSGLVLFSIIFIISILGLFNIMPLERWDIAGWFAWPFQLIIIVFFIISTIIINKKD